MELSENYQNLVELTEGDDVTEILGILKWEKPINAQLAGVCRGNFPTAIPKTDQERVQNLKKEIAASQGMVFEVTEKLEGSSMTVYRINGEFGVCSRNLDLKETEGNSFWSVARRDDLETKMSFSDNFAFQGELIGPGVQGNIYGLPQLEFFVFDIYDIKEGQYMNPIDRQELVARLGMNHAPILNSNFVLSHNIDELLVLAEGKSRLADGVEREGIVFKQNDGGMSFKSVSNLYLIKNGE